MKRVCLFCRISKSNGDLTRQITQLKEVCKKNNYEIIEDFSEKISGAKDEDERIIFSEFINFVLNPLNKIDGVLVHEVSRLGRRISITANTIEKFCQSKIWIYSLKENVYTLNEDGKVNSSALLLINIMQALAENERDTLIYRVNSGIKQSVEDGNSYGGLAPYGYTRINKKFVIVEDEANVVKEVFDLYLNGNMGCMQIAKYLNDKGIKTRYQTINKTFKLKDTIKKPNEIVWSDGQVNKLLKNKLYAGYRVYKGEEVELENCKIIELDDFNAVQNKLKSNFNKKGINTKFKYLIDSNLIKCGECGLSYFAHKRLNGKDNAYKCLSKRYGYKDERNCTNNAINIDKLSRIIWNAVRYSDTFINKLKKEIKSNTKYQEEYYIKEGELKAELRKLAKLAKEENIILDLHIGGNISREVYIQRFKKIESLKKLQDNKCKTITNELFAIKVYIEDLQNFEKQLNVIKSSIDNMYEYVMLIVKKVVIHKVKGDFNFSGAKSDVANVIEIQTKSGGKMYYLVSRWSKSYVKLDEGDFIKGKIVCSIKKIDAHKKEIPINKNNIPQPINP